MTYWKVRSPLSFIFLSHLTSHHIFYEQQREWERECNRSIAKVYIYFCSCLNFLFMKHGERRQLFKKCCSLQAVQPFGHMTIGILIINTPDITHSDSIRIHRFSNCTICCKIGHFFSHFRPFWFVKTNRYNLWHKLFLWVNIYYKKVIITINNNFIKKQEK